MARERITEGDQAASSAAGTGAIDGPARTSAAGPLTVSPRRAVKRAYWAEGVFGIALCLYSVLAVLAYRYAYFELDLSIARWIQGVTVPGFHSLMVWVSFVGSKWMPVALVTATGFALIAARLRAEGVLCLVGVGLGSLVNVLLKSLSARPRPSKDLVQILASVKHESFPSGHVVFFVEYFGLAFFFAYVLLKRGRLRRILLFVSGAMISLIGVSRVYLGAHWPSDVLGAYLAGGIWLMLMIEVYRRMKMSRSQKAGESSA